MYTAWSLLSIVARNVSDEDEGSGYEEHGDGKTHTSTVGSLSG